MLNVFGHGVRHEMLLLYTVEAVCCFAVGYVLLSLSVGPAVPPETHGIALFAALFALLSGPASGAGGLYQPEGWLHGRRLLLGVLVVGLLLLATAVLALLVLPPWAPPTPGWPALVAVVLAIAATVVLTRIGFARLYRGGVFDRRVAVLGAGPEPVMAWCLDRETPSAGAVRTTEIERPTPDRLRALGIRTLVFEDQATLPDPDRQRYLAAGIQLFGKTDFDERRSGRTDLDRLPDNWLARANGTREGPIEAIIRRVLDVGLALGVLLLTLPLLLAAAAAIKLDGPGPIFYRQDRVGRGGRVFRLLKFRSMVTDAEAGGTPRWATRGDPRVTRVGRLLRLTRIDEIPQTLNVLRGDMAFVGPRPERPAFVAQLAEVLPHYNDRACVKPGITGWAQVNFPYGASVEDARAKLTYDLYYVRRRSLFLDLLILVATVRVVLFQEGSR